MEERIRFVLPLLDERQKRIFLAAEAKSYGRGGITAVSKLSGVAPYTIRQGIHEIDSNETVQPKEKLRDPGGGRKRLQEHIPDIEERIQEIVDGATYGNPQNVLSYTTLSLRKIKDILAEQSDIDISFRSVSSILEKLGYSKQINQKMLQNEPPHPDRNGQFVFINNKAADFLAKGLPVISVDTKKKENIGNFKNSGQEYRKEKDPRKVLAHDFPIPELGKVAPYGIYVLNDNTGFVNLGTDHDTSEFAAESILRWWECVGKQAFSEADSIYIDLEHSLFCYISKNWQGQPLIDIETVVNLISSTTTSDGLKVGCQIDTNKYELKRKISDEDFAKIQLFPCETLGNWNYVIKPQNHIG